VKHVILRGFVLSFFILAILTPAATSAKPFTLGLIGEEPAEDIRKILPLSNYLGLARPQQVGSGQRGGGLVDVGPTRIDTVMERRRPQTDI